MKRTLAVLAILVAAPSFAGENLLGTITATTTAQNNATTAVVFDIPEGAKVSVQCDAAGYVLTGKTSAVTASATNAVKVSADALYDTSTPLDGTLSGTKAYISVVAVSGTINCRVFTREGNEG
jgi:hypothetical protein